MTDRITGVLLLALAIAFGLHARTFKTNFLTDPLGPQAWPIMLAVLLGLFSLYLIFRPEAEAVWPKPVVLFRQAVLVGGLIVYALLLEPLGFIVSTVLVMAFMATLLGARWWQAGVTGVVSSVALYVLFNTLLGLPLPAGGLFGG